MTGTFPPIISLLARLIPRLASPFDGEKLATLAAIERTLKSKGLDFNDWAVVVAAPVPARRGPEPDPGNDLSLREIVTWILDHDDGSLDDRERATFDDRRGA
jgi:hypothetical protein